MTVDVMLHELSELLNELETKPVDGKSAELATNAIRLGRQCDALRQAIITLKRASS